MTQKKRIEEMESTIRYLYEKEGRSKNYIAKLLSVNRKSLSDAIAEWGLVKADERHLTPSKKKFLNKYKREIIDMLDSDIPVTEISKKLNIREELLYDIYFKRDKELAHCFKSWQTRALHKRIKVIPSVQLNSCNLEGEEWRDILGYPAYEVSNKGRVRYKTEASNTLRFVKLFQNVTSGRIYVSLQSDNKRAKINLARLVAFTFCTGHDKEHDVVAHMDGCPQNNRSENLKWVSQETEEFFGCIR